MTATTPCEYTKPVSLAHDIDYKQFWNLLNSTVFDVIDKDDHLTSGRVRHMLSRHWLFVNSCGNYQILSKDEVDDLLLRKRPFQKG